MLEPPSRSDTGRWVVLRGIPGRGFMMGKTRNNEGAEAIGGLLSVMFSFLLSTPIGAMFKANIKASLVFWLGVAIGVALSVTVSWKVGLLVFAVIWIVSILMLGIGVLRTFGGKPKSKGRSRNSGDSLFDESFFGDGFPPLFGSTQRLSRPTSAPRTATKSAPTNSCGSAYDDPSLHGVDTDCEHSIAPFEPYRPTGVSPENSDDTDTRHDWHTGHDSSPSDSGGSTSSDGGCTT